MKICKIFITALGIGRDTEANQTVLSEAFLMTCGVNYCPGSATSNTSSSDNSTSESVTEGNFKTTTTQIYTLAGVYLACSLISPLVISALVDPLTRYNRSRLMGFAWSRLKVITITEK